MSENKHVKSLLQKQKKKCQKFKQTIYSLDPNIALQQLYYNISLYRQQELLDTIHMNDAL